MSFTYKYPRPMVTVDAVVFRQNKETGNESGLDSKPDKSGLDSKSNPDYVEVLLIQRKNHPFKSMWALPGGFVDMDETLEKAATRELEEETGLTGVKLKQLHAFSSLERDPRGRNIGVAFYGFTLNSNSKVNGGDDAADAKWFNINQLPKLAFDHQEMVKMALEKITH